MVAGSGITELESLEALGQYLREVREGTKLVLEEVAVQLHIRPLYLKALESGDWTTLPGLAYGRGYLRKYAEFLGLSADEVMEVCDRLQGKVSSRLHYFETVSNEQHPSRWVIGISLLLALLLAVVWYYWQLPEIDTPASDYSLPKELSQKMRRVPAVTPSPYPPAAQECMKMLQKMQDPCYYQQQETEKSWLFLWQKIHN